MIFHDVIQRGVECIHVNGILVITPGKMVKANNDDGNWFEQSLCLIDWIFLRILLTQYLLTFTCNKAGIPNG